MNAKMMEGLVGASMNAQLADTPMNVYEQASREGQKKVEKGREEEKKAEREKEKIEREEALEKSRNEKKEAEKAAEENRRPSRDTVEISEAGKAALQEQPAETERTAESAPVTYTENGEAVPPPQAESTVSFFA